jgi:HAMP domain-containing protein/HD superfamily phosphohydrolase YqeK
MRPRRIRLVWSLLAVLLATALIPLFVTAFVLIDINRESLESARREHELQMAASLASRLDGSLSRARHAVSLAAEELAPRVPSARSGTRVRLSMVRSVFVPRIAGEIVAFRYTAAAGSRSQVGSLEGFKEAAVEEAFFEAFAAVMEGGGIASVPVDLSGGAAPAPGAVVAAPVVRSGAITGAVAALLDLRETWRRGVNPVAADYVVFALGPGGELLAKTNLPEELEEGALRRMEIVQRFLTSGVKFSETMPLSVPGPEGPRELLAASAPTEAGWGLFVMVDRSLAYLAVEEMKWQVWRWASFAVALSGIAAVVAAGLVTRPLKALVEGARRLSRGEFGSAVEVHSRSEMGELADTFNLMSEEIRNHIQRLDKALEENQKLLLGTIRALAAAIDEKDPYTRGHSERVYRYSLAIARHLGMSRSDERNVMISALLHDVGKIGIEDAILRKPAALTDQEFQIMKRHPEKGAHIMEPLIQMKEIIGGIRNHHERWSGGGYPDNLKGEEIPLLARIIQVADSFDAMTTTRPYQRAMKFEAGVARIQELAGIVFDPVVVHAFHGAWIAGDIKVEPRPSFA